ncbi:MAG: hypothetical protein KDA87_20150 [Planctomycetales bacterium]|nr:hypothetical protein [Planctomycetales bacterium]
MARSPSKNVGICLAVTWNARQLTYLLTRIKRQHITVVDLGTESIADADDDDSPPAAAVGQAIQAVLDRNRLKKCEVLVGVGRSQLEILELTLPPATDAELPNMVRSEVARRLGENLDRASIDFVLRQPRSAEDTARRVDAAVLREDARQEMDAACQFAKVTPHRIIPRPYAIASLFGRIAGNKNAPCLVINRNVDIADLSVYANGHVEFTRTVQLPNGLEERDEAKLLATEVVRTIMVKPSEEADAPEVDRIYVFGNTKHSHVLIENLAEEAALPVTILNPFDQLAFASGAVSKQAHLYSALVGMVRDHAEDSVSIDFIHPKQPPAPPDYRKKAALYGSLATVAMGIIGWSLRADIVDVRQENQEVVSELDKSNAFLEKLQKKTATVKWVQAWQNGEVNWLDELKDLSERFPEGEAAVVDRMTLAQSNGNNGAVVMSVRVADPTVLANFEANLRDDHHSVSSKRITESASTGDYAFQFETNVVIRARTKEAYQQALAVRDAMSATTDSLQAEVPTLDPKNPIDSATENPASEVTDLQNEESP